MNPKYSLKVIKQGQTQKVQTVAPGAGMQGQALVVQAIDGARVQLADIVTLTAPDKLQMKRMGKDLQIALPGGDVEAPDIVVKDYYSVKDMSLVGQNLAGEWQMYSAANLPDMAPPSATPEGTAAQSQSWSSGNLFNPTGVQSVGMTDFTAAGAASSMGVSSMIALGAGGLALAGGAGGGSGGGAAGGTSGAGSTTATNSSLTGLDALKAYASPSGVTSPTLNNYSEAGLKALAQLSETTATGDITSNAITSAIGTTKWLAALNSALHLQDSSSLTLTKVQNMVNSYYRILSEADNDASVNVDVYPSVTDAKSGASLTGNNDPSAEDYTNIGATVGNAKSVDLLNDYVGRSDKSAVDTVDEINTIAKAAYNVMVQAGVTASTSNAPATYSSTDSNAEWIAGLNTLLGLNTTTGVNSNNVVAVKAAIAGHTDGTAVDTVQEIKDLIKTVIALQTLKDYANAINGSGATIPTLSTYKDAGVKALNDLNETGSTASADITTLGTTNVGSTWLSALNSALDKQIGDSTLTTAKIQNMAASYYRILSEADNDASVNVDVYPSVPDAQSGASLAGNNDPSAEDYTNIGATVGNAKSVDLLNDYVGRSDKSAVDTVDEINTIAKAAYNVMVQAGVTASTSNAPATYSTTDSNAEWIAGLNTLLGLNTTTGVNSNNVVAVKAAIAGHADGTAVDTVQEIKNLVSQVRIQAFVNDSGNYYASSATNTKNAAGVPTLDDWSQYGSGISANTSLTDPSTVALSKATYWKTTNPTNVLMALNSALDTFTLSGTTTTDHDTLQKIVDSYGRILQEADGSRATNTDVSKVAISSGETGPDVGQKDLEYIGVSCGGTDNQATGTGLYYLKTGELLASSIGSLSSTAVDTIAELNALSVYAQNVMKQATGITTGSTYTDSEWLNALSGLGIAGATASNISEIKTAIAATKDDGSSVASWDQLQGIVSLVRLNDYAAQSNGYSTPTISDYQAILADKLDASHYSDINNNKNFLQSYNSVIDAQSSLISATSTENDINDAIAKVSNMVTSYTSILNSTTDNSHTSFGTSGSRAATFKYVLDSSAVASHGSTINSETVADAFADIISHGLSQSNVSTYNQLKTLDGILSKIFTMAANTATSTSTVTSADYTGLTQSDLGSLGLKGLDGNLISINNMGNGDLTHFDDSLIKSGSTFENGSAIDTYAEIQTLLNKVLQTQQAVIV